MLLAAMEAALLLMVVFFCIMGGMGIYEAWSRKRGPAGWIVSFLISIAGGALTMGLCVAIGDAMIGAKSRLSAIGEGLNMVTPILMLLGSWLALRLAGRFR